MLLSMVTRNCHNLHKLNDPGRHPCMCVELGDTQVSVSTTVYLSIIYLVYGQW